MVYVVYTVNFGGQTTIFSVCEKEEKAKETVDYLMKFKDKIAYANFIPAVFVKTHQA